MSDLRAKYITPSKELKKVILPCGDVFFFKQVSGRQMAQFAKMTQGLEGDTPDPEYAAEASILLTTWVCCHEDGTPVFQPDDVGALLDMPPSNEWRELSEAVRDFFTETVENFNKKKV